MVSFPLNYVFDIYIIYILGFDGGSEPFVILVGDVGSGKSTLFEKLTGTEGRSSSAKESFTRDSVVCKLEGQIKICDTPGSNAMTNGLEHNAWIAKAINHQKVSKLFIIVRADKAIENVLENVNNYRENFLDFPEEALSVCVTHMDLVSWKCSDLLGIIEEETGIQSKSVIFSKPEISCDVLLHDFIKQCDKEHTLTALPKHFKVNDMNIKISKRDVGTKLK